MRGCFFEKKIIIIILAALAIYGYIIDKDSVYKAGANRNSK